jgi:CRISPR type III-A-associated protein Csm2
MKVNYQQRDQMDPIKELIRKLEGKEEGEEKKEKTKSITELLSERDIFHPDGYASKVMKYIISKNNRVKITSVQLRRVFYEFKAIVDDLRREKKKGKEDDLNKTIERAMGRLYRLYAILEYQTGRGVLNRDFKELMFKLFDSIEREIEEEKERKEKDKIIEAFEKVYDFLMAMVAYSKRS